MRYGGPVDVPPPDDHGFVPLAQVPAAALAAYDRQHLPAPREAFLTCWVKPARRCGFAYVIDGTLAGYGVVRECRAGWKIGPLFAAREAVADALFRRLAAEVPAGQPLYLDPPEPNRAAQSLVARYGLTPVFETARMYKGPAPALPLDRIFGITTFELG